MGPQLSIGQKINYSIVELNNLSRCNDFEYVALSNDPGMLINLEIDQRFLDCKDCHVRMITSIKTKFDKNTTELSFDDGNGISEANKITRHSSWGEAQEYIINRRFVGKPFRFDPSDKAGKFSVKYLHFYVWSAQASKAVIIWDFFRRSHDSTSVWQKKSAVGSCPGLHHKVFDTFYDSYMRSEPEVLHNPYSLWAKYVEKSQLARIRSAISWNRGIKFSLLMPTYNSNPIHLAECIESVLEQEYDNWELCIVDDCSTNPDTINVLLRLSKKDSRIKFKRRDKNGHICRATNDALEMASGDRICFLDHDDRLEPNALHCLALEISKNPNLDLIYTDEDFISLDGRRIRPHFKSDWNADLLLSHNYITHLVCVRADRTRAIGGLRVGTEGAQDYDFLLRYTNDLNPEKILHLPYILYHWRISESSTAGSRSAKPYTVSAGEKALKDFISLKNINATVLRLDQDNFYEVRRNVLDPSVNKVSIIIPTRNSLKLLRTCVESILSKTLYPNYEVVIVDNGSDDVQTLDYLSSLGERTNILGCVRVVSFNEPFNYSRINNFAFQHASGNLICLLNNDTEVIEPNWLGIMAGHALRPDVGCVGSKLLYEDNTIQHAGIVLSIGGSAGHYHKGLDNSSHGYFLRPHLTQEVSAVTGACLMVKSEIYSAVNGLDEMLFPIAFNDVDFCLKVRKLGLRNIYVPSSSLYHYESKSRGYEDTPEKKKRFQKELASLHKSWGHLLREDPFYNPNLTKDREDFSYRVA